jgi:O-methyltransferase
VKITAGAISRNVARTAKRLSGRRRVRLKSLSDIPRWYEAISSAVERDIPADFSPDTVATIEAARPFTFTSAEALEALCQATRYLARAHIPGAFVECGVRQGGSVIAMARTLLGQGVDDRDLYLFDTFGTIPSTTGPEDVDFLGVRGRDYEKLAEASPSSPPEEVRRLVEATGYPSSRIQCVVGLVEETIPSSAPDVIALLRLDTDYYASTKHELTWLFPRISHGGVLVIDDYGHQQGCRKATDEYLDELSKRNVHVLLQRVDYKVRLAVVP